MTKQHDHAEDSLRSIRRKPFIGALVACLIILAGASASVYHGNRLSKISDQAVRIDAVDSQLASRASIATLSCRRFEKDVFLNLADKPSRAKYFHRWQQALETLDCTLGRITARSMTERRRQQCTRWRQAATNYRRHFLSVYQSIEQGQITAPSEANQAITPFKDTIRALIREAAAFGESSGTLARDSAANLQASIRYGMMTSVGTALVSCVLISLWTFLFTRKLVGESKRLAVYSTQLERQGVELREAQEIADDANRSKSEFLANMSHELRSPMTAILGFADELSYRAKDPQDQEAVTTIRRNGRHLLTIVNDILDLSKIEAGRIDVEKIACSPQTIIQEVASPMTARARDKKITFDFTFENAIPETIETDPTRLRQVLINLVGNAIKFTDQGRVSLKIKLLDGDSSAARLEFRVCDSGIGMNQEQIGRLFTPFTQADSSTTRRFGGTGLGLVISRRLTELLGGTLSVESTPGEGSVFTATVPTGCLQGVRLLDRAEVVVEQRTTEQQQPSKPAQLNCRVLLAEDSVDNQRLFSVIIRRAGAEIVIADNGRIAVDLATEALAGGKPFDLLLMDMQMPVLDGYGAARELRDAGYKLPIIALTANAMSDDYAKCIKAGCNDYATKPIDRDRLLTLIAQHTTTSLPI